MFHLNQWVTWEPVQYPNEPKPCKIPCNYRDAHDPANWMPYDAARAITSNTGFVFTENDPYFFIDIDHALEADGSWSPIVHTVCAMFPGAYMEIGFSRDGIHIIGQGVIPEGFKRKNQALGLECYDRLRYAAITGIEASGSTETNHQDALNAFVTGYMEVAQAMNPVNWSVGPRSDWNGPADDDELIERMLKARPSANALWGGTVTVRDLWEGNTQAFVDSYPDTSEKGYDASSPDMALATHLAFWTGCDCDRIVRLMWRSGLARDKWTNHPTYLKEFTISKAVGSCQNVYSDPRATQAPVQQPMQSFDQAPQQQLQLQTVDQLTGQLRQGFQYLTPDAQLQFFKGCVYIVKTHTILRPNGMQVSPEQFKVIYGGYEFAMDNENRKSKSCPWVCFTQSQAVKFPIVESLLFRPELEPGLIIEHEGMLKVNSYRPPIIRCVDGDVSPFLDLLQKLFPDERDRAIYLAYLAACVQHVGTKFQWCPLVQGVEGNGKSFFTRALIYASGSELSHLVNPKDVTNKFNSWVEGKTFVGVEEVYVSDRRDALDAMKILITNDRLEIQSKGGNQYMGDNRANFNMTTNHQDAIRKTKNDRRYAPFFTPQQSIEDINRDGLDGDYFPNLYGWARADGYAIVANFLNTYQIPDELNPATKMHRAPETSSTTTAIQVSQGPVEQEIMNAIEEGVQGFRGGWVSSVKLNDLLIRTGKARFVSQNKRTEVMESLGYSSTGRCSMTLVQEDNKRPVLYMLPGTYNTGDLALDYMLAQGYVTP